MAILSPPLTRELSPFALRRPVGVLRSSMRLWRTRIGMALVALLGGVALFGSLIAPHGPGDFVGSPNSGPATGTPFGTDYLGQDVWSRFLDGGFEILALATLATLLGLAVGSTLGLLAAYSRGLQDDVIMRAMDVILAFPNIMLALVLISIAGPSAWLIVLAVGLSNTPGVARVTRGAAQPIVVRDFVALAEAIGLRRSRILFSEVLPNILSPLVVEASLRLTNSIVAVASLAFLGFTIHPNGADWGLMIQENQIALVVQPWGVLLPMTAVALLTIGTGLIGDGIARTAAGIDRARAAD
jgi:peptide/nickel transport system permease protein